MADIEKKFGVGNSNPSEQLERAFHYFSHPKFPPELRILIWKFAIPLFPRLIKLQPDWIVGGVQPPHACFLIRHAMHTFTREYLNPISLVNHESRKEYLLGCQYLFNKEVVQTFPTGPMHHLFSAGARQFMINLNCDPLYFHGTILWVQRNSDLLEPFRCQYWNPPLGAPHYKPLDDTNESSFLSQLFVQNGQGRPKILEFESLREVFLVIHDYWRDCGDHTRDVRSRIAGFAPVESGAAQVLLVTSLEQALNQVKLDYPAWTPPVFRFVREVGFDEVEGLSDKDKKFLLSRAGNYLTLKKSRYTRVVRAVRRAVRWPRNRRLFGEKG